MFSRKNRLARSDFGAALRTSRRVSSAHFLILYPEGVQGYAVVIPKKVIKLSSSRHRVKRQVLEALRALKLPPALIVFPRSAVSGVHYEDIQAELKDLIAKINS